MATVVKNDADEDSSTRQSSVQNEVQELRRKYDLLKKDAVVYRERREAEIQENYHIIQGMRLTARDMRVSLVGRESMGERVIQEAFRDDRKKRLANQSLTIPEVICHADNEVCNGHKLHSLMQYESEKRERKLRELQDELDGISRLQSPSLEQQRAEQKIAVLENSLEKALIKHETAKVLGRKYAAILDNLKGERRLLPAKLDALEEGLKQQRSDLRKLKVMNVAAQKARDEAKKKQSREEKDIENVRRQRESELTALRKEVEKRKTLFDKVDKRHHARVIIIQDGTDANLAGGACQRRDVRKTLLTCEEAYKRIREATHVKSIEEVVERFQTQGKTLQQLGTQAKELEGQRVRVKKELQKRMKQRYKMKFNGERRLSKGQKILEEMEKHMEDERKRLKRAAEELKRHGSALIGIRSCLKTLLEKLDQVKLRPPKHNYSRGNVFEELQLCQQKLLKLLSDLATLVFGKVRAGSLITAGMEEQMRSAKFQEFLENQLSPENVRVCMRKSEAEVDFEYDEHKSEAPSRQDIKQKAEKLVELKTAKPRKGKEKK